MIDEIKKFALKNNIPIIMDGGINFILEYIKNNNIKSILEVGSAIGYSSILMASLSDDIYVETIELNKERYEIALKNIKECNLDKRVKIFNEDALRYTPTRNFELIFVDAAKAQYKKYMEYYLPYCKGVFIFDNINFHGIVDNIELTKNRNTKSLVRKIKKFKEEILIDERFETLFYKEIGDGIMVCKVKNV